MYVSCGPYFRDGGPFFAIWPLWVIGMIWVAPCRETINPAATDVFQEAFILPPVKLAKAGEINQDIIDIMLRNTRLPQSAMGDLNGQLSALDLGIKRMDELLDEYGANTISSALNALGHRAERLMRSELEALPNGRWEAEDFLDNDGIEDTPLAIKVALEIQGDQMTLDFHWVCATMRGACKHCAPNNCSDGLCCDQTYFPKPPRQCRGDASN